MSILLSSTIQCTRNIRQTRQNIHRRKRL
uniref:Uncharacterized protein n=1 Tax=Lotus japonicus TaxID=34305 RepID=I3STH7_LOTJA|nr:unknown [Lotus japonicus]